MKQIISIIFCIVFIFTLAGCGGGKYPLNGIWSGQFTDDNVSFNVSVAFIDDYCFAFNESSVDEMKYTYEKSKGTLTDTNRYEIHFSVKNNIMNYTVEGRDIVLNRDKSAKPAPDAIKGVWKDAEGVRIMAFVNDYAFLSNGRINAYGFHSFDNNEGFFITNKYQLQTWFFVDGEKINAIINGSEYTFFKM